MMRRAVAGLLLGLLGACSAHEVSTAASPAVPSPQAQLSAPGYLPRAAIPNSLLLNPPPPAPGSAAVARDEEASRAGLALRGTPRWDVATRDADLFSAKATSAYSCAAGFEVGPTSTPRLDALLRRAARDLSGSTNPTKDKYMRARPFTVNGQPICTPEADAALRRNGSYPSGHSAIGYGWGLIMAQTVPDRAGQLVARGRAFGDSRRICNVHWLSDVEEGQVVATAVVARMNSEPAFQADLAAARAEVAALKPREPGADCAVEAAILGG